ncbi:von willebrand factor type A domain protein (macronuclear) [Tetrahymena thermophila SB210]|uniref:von willebrand factor type A domain protein n=1 Tax=Tetrahymena thermophila (strain SB210) TaxID=312017 RepID=Q23J98_TETTS|nr:von willebrand factor type A domain protein [Tetrahymena thermophila SB210]EAR96606.2 von willebrand factor type A domain protein [Tetrahymena thermophila SB210]|eukprot:XP_001016851.2 von willebrand factor type A domain protein [Tetrahymena thermophila SB210]
MFKPYQLRSLDFQFVSSTTKKSFQTPATLQSIQYQGIIKDKDQAEQEYQENKSQGNFVTYAEINSFKDQDYCKIQLGNLPPSQQVEVNIIFSQQLNSFINKYFIAHIPIIYCNDEVSAKLGKNLLTLDLSCTGKILYAESKGYQAEKIMLDDQSAKFNISQALLQKGKDYYQLIYSFDGMFNPQVIFGQSKIFNEDSVKSAILPVCHSAMISFIPNFNEEITQEIDDTIRAAISNGDDIFSDEYQQKLNQELIDHLNSSRSEFIFILDRSGSMRGQPIRRACEAIILFLKSLPNDSYFNVISFGSSFEKLFPFSTKYTSESLEKAVQIINNYDSDLGGTEIYNPLHNVFIMKRISGYNRQIFLLTDGEVDSSEQVIELIKKNNKYNRVHSIGFGFKADQYLIKESAIAGKGISKIVDQNCDLSEVIINMLSLCITPTFDEFKITYDNTVFDSTYPSSTDFPCVFKDEIINIHFFFKPLLEFQSLTEQQKKIQIQYYDSHKQQNVLKEIELQMQDNFTSNHQLQESVFKIGKQLYLNENIQNQRLSSQLIQQAIDFQLLTSKTALICFIEEINDEQRILYKNINHKHIHQNMKDEKYYSKLSSPKPHLMFDCYFDSEFVKLEQESKSESELELDEDEEQEEEIEVEEQHQIDINRYLNNNKCCINKNYNRLQNINKELEQSFVEDQKSCQLNQYLSKGFNTMYPSSGISNVEGQTKVELSDTSIKTQILNQQNVQIEQKRLMQNKSYLPKLEVLLNLVNSQGIWNFDHHLLMHLSQIDENNIMQLCSQFASKDAFMTLFILIILEINYSSQKSKWVLISKKSISYVKSQLNKNQNYNSMKQNIQQLISK